MELLQASWACKAWEGVLEKPVYRPNLIGRFGSMNRISKLLITPYNNDITGWKAAKRIGQTNGDMTVKSEFPIYFYMVIPPEFAW